MENRNKYFVWGALTILVPIALYVFAPRQKKQVLSENISITPTITSSPTETFTPTASPSATLTPTPTKTPKFPIPKPVSSAEVNVMIERFAAQYSVDPNVMRHLAICESGFNSSAINGVYVGLYQFGPITWKDLRKEFGEDPNINLRFSAEEATQTAAYALSLGKGGIWPDCAP